MTTYKYITNEIVAVIDDDGVSRTSGLASVLVPDGAEIIPLDSPAPEEIIAGYVLSLEEYYDSIAKEKNYDNRYTCSIRAGYVGPFQAEGEAFAKWMDACNAYAYQELEKVRNGQRAIPGVSEFLSELPSAPW